MGLTFRMAERFEVPMIIAGWTKGQMTSQPVLTKCACNASSPEYARMGQATKEFLAGLKGDPNPPAISNGSRSRHAVAVVASPNPVLCQFGVGCPDMPTVGPLTFHCRRNQEVRII